MNYKKILITIDTEVGEEQRHIDNAFDKFVRGNIDGDEYGFSKIADIINEFGFMGDFFIDVYDTPRTGIDLYGEICDIIKSKGHKNHLHTHPAGMFDEKRKNMHEYSLEEQKKIIKKGKDIFRDITGKNPVAHRAGNYGADNKTLTALRENGIKIDSSFFFNNHLCKIEADTINKPVEINGVQEIPITVAKRYPKRFGLPLLFLPRWSKQDINSFDFWQLKKMIREVTKEVNHCMIFLHSSSFIHHDRVTDKLKPRSDVIKRFRNILSYLKKEGFEPSTIDSLL